MASSALGRVYVEDGKWLGVIAGLTCVAPLCTLGFVAYLAMAGFLPASSPGQLLSNVLTWAGIGVVGGVVAGIIPALLTTILLVLLQRRLGYLHLGLFILACLPAVLVGLVLLVGTNPFYDPPRFLADVAGIGGLILFCVVLVWLALARLGVLQAHIRAAAD